MLHTSRRLKKLIGYSVVNCVYRHNIGINTSSTQIFELQGITTLCKQVASICKYFAPLQIEIFILRNHSNEY